TSISLIVLQDSFFKNICKIYYTNQSFVSTDIGFLSPDTSSLQQPEVSFDFANVHIAVYNTYDGLFTFSNEQLKWIESDLKAASANSEIDHIFTVMHHGPYSASNHGDNATAKSKVVPLLKKYGVDMTLAGHDHNYERGEADGLRYIVAGGGGAPLYSAGQSQYTIYSESVLHYVVFNVYGPDVSGCAYRVDGSVMDCFNWTKGKLLPDAGYEDISSDDIINQDTNEVYDSNSSDTQSDVFFVDVGILEDSLPEDLLVSDSLSPIDGVLEVVADSSTVLDVMDVGKDVNLMSDFQISVTDSERKSNGSESSGCGCLIIE
ncbi:MAG: metallophosphoesterase family protein, partial [Myxococcota bacterium]